MIMEYLQAGTMPKDSTLTIACLLVEQVISRHSVPTELSDRGKAFLSKLLHKVYDLMGMKKVNTVVCHPQTDGLVERFNRTLTSMLGQDSKEGQDGSDWDKHLPYVHKSPPFYCTEGNLRLPRDQALSAAWKLAREQVQKAQRWQKTQRDNQA